MTLHGAPPREVRHAEVTIWGTFHGSTTAVKTVLAGVLLSRLGGFLNLFAVLYLTSQGYSDAQASLAVGCYGAGAVAGVLLGGILADRMGARTATMVGMGATAALTASLLYLPYYSLLLVAMTLASLAGQLYRPASTTLLSALTPQRSQVVVFAMYRFGMNAGAMAAPLVGLGLYHLGGGSYSLVFWGEAAIAFAYVVVAALALPRQRSTAAPRAALGAPAHKPRRPAGDAPSPDRLAVLRDRRYLLYLAAALVNGIVYVQYLSTLPMDVQAHHIDVFWYSTAVSVNGALVIAVELPLTKLSQNWPTKLTVGLCCGLIGLGVGLYGLPMSATVIIGATLVWTLGEIIGGPAVFAYPASAGPPALRASYISSFQLMQALGSALGPVLGGLLFTRLGHGFWPLLGAGGALSAALAVAAIRTPAQASRHEEPRADSTPHAPTGEDCPVP